jgi:hypothetical protein
MAIEIPQPQLPPVNPALVQALAYSGTPRTIDLAGEALRNSLSAILQGRQISAENSPIDPALASRLGISQGTPSWLAQKNAPLYEAASKTLSPNAAALMFGGGKGTPGTSSSATPGTTPDFSGIPVDIGTKVYSEGQSNQRQANSIAEQEKRMNFEQNEAHQSTLENQAVQRVASIRGDPSLKNIEEQRDAAITAYNRIGQIEKSGQGMNPIDYVDVLGQVYKARTGQAPTNEVLSQARQATLQGNMGKAFTFLTGQQAPATSHAIMGSLKNMVFNMGQQADTLHDGYMKSHLIKPTGLDDDRWQSIASTGRGLSFQDATGGAGLPNTNNPGGGMGSQGATFASEDDANAAVAKGFSGPATVNGRKAILHP